MSTFDFEVQKKYQLSQKYIFGGVILCFFLLYLGSQIFSSPGSEFKKESLLQKETASFIETNDFANCTNISDDLYKKVCINNIALNLSLKAGDVNYCQKVDGKLVSIEECESGVIFPKAIEKESILVCKEATNTNAREQCEKSFISELANHKNDLNLCINIIDNVQRESCRNEILFRHLMVSTVGEFDCSQFKDENVQNDCLVLLMAEAVVKEVSLENYGEIPFSPIDLSLKTCTKFLSPFFRIKCLDL